MIQAQTFTFKYNVREDRIIMSINYTSNTSRLDLMITRAMVLKLIPVIEQIYLTEASPEQAPQKLKREVRGKENITDNDILEVMERKRHLLEKIDFKSFQNSSNIALIFYVDENAIAQAVLNRVGFKQIMDVMIQSIPHHSWGIAANILHI